MAFLDKEGVKHLWNKLVNHVSNKADEAKLYADNAALAVKNDLLNGAGGAYDTLKELGDLIDNNQDAITALESVATGKADKDHTHDDRYYTESEIDTKLSGKADKDHTHDDRYYTESEIDTKLSGKADKDHTHDDRYYTESEIDTKLSGKADASHGTHVFYSTTAPVMDGTASVGTASTVARSDHKHPIDTSRASKTEFDTHATDTTKHVTSTERTNWGDAYTHSQAAHAPSNAEKNQNAFSNIAVSGQTTVAADTTTDTVIFVGSNIVITTDATNDKVTFAVADGSTSAKGVVQLTNSTSSTSTTTAATPNSVKSAYDLANTAKTNAATAQAKADSAYTLAEGKVSSLSDLGITTTAAELNYMDGVTSNVQTQLNTKAKISDINPVVTTTGTGSAYAATVESIGALTAGVSFTMIPHIVSASTAPTLNVNGLGAKTIRRRVSNSTTSTGAGYNASWLGANKPIRVEYDGTFWIADLPKPAAADMSGTLSVKSGGTGATTLTAGSYIIGNGTSAVTFKTPAEVLADIGAVDEATVNSLIDAKLGVIENGSY